MAVLEAIPAEPGLAEELERVRALLDAGWVEEARRLASELAVRRPEDPDAQRLARVLAPPKVIASRVRAGRTHEAERAWLKAHAREYPGRWLAAYEDRLIAADPALARVLQSVRQAIGEEGAVLFYQPASEP
jgi:hypothetical protein